MVTKERWAAMSPEQKQKEMKRQREWQQRNKEKCREYQRKARKEQPDRILSTDLKSRYGITLEEYNTILESQNFKCAICGTDDPTNKRQKRFHVDHCHETGEVRGLLCGECNKGLGCFKDNKETIMNAFNYLQPKGVIS